MFSVRDGEVVPLEGSGRKLGTAIILGFAIGAIAEVAIGVAIDDLALGISIGVGVGLIFGAALGAINHRPR